MRLFEGLGEGDETAKLVLAFTVGGAIGIVVIVWKVRRRRKRAELAREEPGL